VNNLFTPVNIQISVGLMALLLAVGIWRHVKSKEMRVARAYTYLAILKRQGSTEEVANMVALTTDGYGARQLKREIALHIDEKYNGSQQAMISDAKAKGYRG